MSMNHGANDRSTHTLVRLSVPLLNQCPLLGFAHKIPHLPAQIFNNWPISFSKLCIRNCKNALQNNRSSASAELFLPNSNSRSHSSPVMDDRCRGFAWPGGAFIRN